MPKIEKVLVLMLLNAFGKKIVCTGVTKQYNFIVNKDYLLFHCILKMKLVY